MHRGQHCWAVCNVPASLLLHASQWITHSEDAVQLGQTRGLFLLPSGRPHLRGGAGPGIGSETGSAQTVGSSTGVTSVGGCNASGSSAGVGAGRDSVTGVVDELASGGTVGGTSRG